MPSARFGPYYAAVDSRATSLGSMITLRAGRRRLEPIAFSRISAACSPNRVTALVDGGEGHAQQIGIVHVAHADHLDVLRNPDLRLQCAVRRRWFYPKIPSGRGLSASSRRAASYPVASSCADDVRVGHRKLRGSQRVFVALKPSEPGRDRRT